MTACIRLLPGGAFFAYLTLTVLLFAWGPWPWPVQDSTLLYSFLAAAHVAFLLGYLSGAFRRPAGYHQCPVRSSFLLSLSLLLSVLLLPATSVARTGSLLPDVWSGFVNPGAAYNRSFTLRLEPGPLVVVEYARIVLAPLLVLALPMALYYWPRLRGGTKLMAVLLLLGTIALFVSMGTNKALADLVLMVPWIVLASHVAGLRRLTVWRVTAATGLLLLAFAGFFLFFTSGQLTRAGSGARAAYFSRTATYADQTHPLVRWMPDDTRAGALALAMYATHGYYALHLSLQEPFIPMFGVGNSYFLYRNAARITGWSWLESLPYPVRIERRGWDSFGLWSSIYPWLASDLSFPGTVLFVFLVGRLLALSWVDSLRGVNPIAVAVFAQLVVMVAYFPANNQLMQGGESLSGFVVSTAAWLYTRRPRGPRPSLT